MKISEAIEQVDSLKQNVYTEEDKIRWLSDLDFMVKKHIIDTHEGGESVEFSGYTVDTDIETELLIPAPYDKAYLRWLEAQIDYHNREYSGYNNSILLFNTEFDAFANYYNRNHMPLGKKIKFF